MKKQILLFCFLFFAMIGFAENVNITGVVTSAEDGEPLIGASVMAITPFLFRRVPRSSILLWAARPRKEQL